MIDDTSRKRLQNGEQKEKIVESEHRSSESDVCDGDEIKNRVDRHNMESRSRLHKNKPRM